MPRLRDLETIEVSLVKRGANKKKFLIYKSLEGGEVVEDFTEILKTELENNAKAEEVLMAMKLSEKAKNAVMGALRLLSAYKGELPPGIISTLSDLTGIAQKEETKKEIETEGGKKMDKEIKKEELNIEEIKKELSPEYQEKLENLYKSNQEMAKITKDLQEQIKKSEDVRLIKEYVEIAKTYENISMNTEEFGKVLKEINDKSPEAMVKLQEVLKSANEAIKAGSLFKEIGSSAQGESDAWGKIEAIAKEMAVTGKMTKEVAITKALELNPDLYSAYIKESEGGK